MAVIKHKFYNRHAARKAFRIVGSISVLAVVGIITVGLAELIITGRSTIIKSGYIGKSIKLGVVASVGCRVGYGLAKPYSNCDLIKDTLSRALAEVDNRSYILREVNKR